MIATLTLNPALDKSTTIEQLIPEKKMRCSRPLVEAGGGGINVSKAICELGGNSMAIFPVGGATGQQLLQLLHEKYIQTVPIEISEHTRESFIVTETTTNKEYKFVMPGPAISNKEIESIKEQIERLQNISYLVCSGSLPPNVPDNLIAEIANIAKQKEIKFIVDTSGHALKKALEQGIYLLKPNLTELCSLVNKQYLNVYEIDDAAVQIIQTGKCEVIVVSMGPAGALLITKNEKYKFPAPVVKKISTVGAGDSMVAGIVLMLDQGKTLKEAVQFGLACGTAATISNGEKLLKKEDAIHFYNWMKNARPVEA